jgi:hypothetical protein
MEEVPMLVDLGHVPEEFPKVAWGNFGKAKCLGAFPPANTSSPAQKPKGQSLDQWFRYLQIHNG